MNGPGEQESSSGAFRGGIGWLQGRIPRLGMRLPAPLVQAWEMVKALRFDWQTFSQLARMDAFRTSPARVA